MVLPSKRALDAHVEPKHHEVPLRGDLLVGQVQHRPKVDQGGQSETLLHFNHSVGNTFLQLLLFSLSRRFGEVLVGHQSDGWEGKWWPLGHQDE